VDASFVVALGGPIREIKIPVQELWLKCRGAYMRRGVYTMYVGHYGI